MDTESTSIVRVQGSIGCSATSRPLVRIVLRIALSVIIATDIEVLGGKVAHVNLADLLSVVDR